MQLVLGVFFIILGVVIIIFGHKKVNPLFLKSLLQLKFGEEGKDSSSVSFWKWSLGLIFISLGLILLYIKLISNAI